MTEQEELEREAKNKAIAEARGWTDVHGGLADGGAYLRGRAPGSHPSSGCYPIPDYAAEEGHPGPDPTPARWARAEKPVAEPVPPAPPKAGDVALLVATAEILTRRGICNPHE
jgi:hypothetical protein